MKNFIFIVCCSLLTANCFAQAGMWTWMKGDSVSSPIAHYGTQGTFDSLNTPQGLYEAGQWQDSSGNFWLFGGVDDPALQSYQNSLWKYDHLTNEWSWIAGSQTCCQAGNYGTLGVPNPTNYPGSRKVPSTWVDDQNCFWMFGGEGIASNGLMGDLNDLWKYNPSINEWTWVSGGNLANQPAIYGVLGVPNPSNVPGARHECVATWKDHNGALWLFGGYGFGISVGYLNDLWKYDVATNEWTWMNGSNSPDQFGNYGTMGIPSSSNSPGGRCSYTHWLNCTGDKFWLSGGFGFAASGYTGSLDDLWQYDIANNWWTWINGTNTIDYTGLYVATCDSSALNAAKARFEARACWTDKTGNFWMIGGAKSTGLNTFYNDLWVYNADVNKWMWVSGQSTNAPLGFYGIKGIASPNNFPIGKVGGISWYNSDDVLWYFGGGRYSGGTYNDMWKYQIDPSCTFSAICNSVSIAYSATTTDLCEKFCTNFFDQSTNNPTSWQWNFPGGTPSSSTLQNPTNICYNSPGTYDVTLITTNSNGSDTLTLSNYITVYSTPAFPTITQNGYTLTSSPAFSYQWQLNSTDIPGATNQSYNITQTGYYTVIVGDSNGCVNSATQYVLIEGISESDNGNSIAVYPNPSGESFTVEWLSNSAAGKISIDVVNALGKKVFSSEEKSAPSFKKEIDLGNIPAGVYFLELKSENVFLEKKLIITK